MHRYIPFFVTFPLLLVPCGAFLAFNDGVSRTRKRSIKKNDDDDDVSLAVRIQEQAESLRFEAEAMRLEIEASKEARLANERAKVDSWIEELLISQTISEDLQLLNTVEQVTALLQDGRFSQEQVNKMFDKLTEAGNQSRSKCSPILELLVDAAGKLDTIDDNPNKRWSGKVERRLRKRLFAMDWGMDLEDEDDDRLRWI